MKGNLNLPRAGGESNRERTATDQIMGYQKKICGGEESSECAKEDYE